MNIRSKITLPMILMPLAACIVVLLVCIYLYASQAEEVQKERVFNAANAFEDDFVRNQHDVEQSSKAMSFDKFLIDGFEHRRDVILRVEELKDKTYVDFVYVTDDKGIIIYCSYSPAETGNSLADEPHVKKALEGELSSGVFTGSEILLSIQAANPVYGPGNKLLGTVVSGVRIDTDEYVDYVQSLTGSEVTISLGIERIATTILTVDGERAIGTDIDEDVWAIVEGGNNYVGKINVMDKGVIGEYRPLVSNGTVIGIQFVGLYTESTDNAINRFVIMGFIVALIIMIIAGVLGVKISGKIVSPLQNLVNVAHRIALGDVNVNVKTDRKDETAELTKAFSEMIECFKEQANVLTLIADGDYTREITPKSSDDLVGNAILSMIRKNNDLLNEMRITSEEVSKGSIQIANSAQALSSGSSEQSVSIQKFAETIREFKNKAEYSDSLAEKTYASITEAGHLLKENFKFMEQMTASMKDINAGSKSIAGIINIIDNIAFQTNILALNAAVEAARAGTKGKGFAVVADEVRKLARQSADAANQTTELVTNNMLKVEQGTEISTYAYDSIVKVEDIATNNLEYMKKISEASSLQIDMVTDLSEGIEQISNIVESNSSAAEENAAAAAEMSAQSVSLDQTIMKFKMKKNVKT